MSPITSNRQSYFPQIDKEVDPKVTVHLQQIYPALNDHDQAINTLSSQFNSFLSFYGSKSSGNTVTAPTTNPVSSSSSSSSSSVTASQAQSIASNTISTTLGPVNNQTGTSYTAQGSDYGGIVTINNASAVTVTLNPAVQSQWFSSFENIGTGVATLTPGIAASGAAGKINGSANISISQNQGALVFFDGVNWWSVTSPSLSASAVTSLNGETGAVTLTSSGGTIAITEPTANTINLETVASGGVSSVNSQTGAVSLIAGSNITITPGTPSAGDITIAATGGGGGFLTGTVSVSYGSTPFVQNLGTGTVTGATVGMPAIACSPTGISGGSFNGVITASVTATDTVTVSVALITSGNPPATLIFPVVVFT